MFSFEDFQIRAQRYLLAEPASDWNHSDDDMNERARLIPDGVTTKPAAVLIGILMRDEPMVILTRRQEHLAKHPGQIAFPGGRLEEGETVQEAALREANEEIGLASHFVSPLGYCDNFLTITHFVVSPLVALVSPNCLLKADESEVSEIFEVPLAFLMDIRNCQAHYREFKGDMRQYYVYEYGRRYIWGATAGMIRILYERLYA